jgi:hypothetical protein
VFHGRNLLVIVLMFETRTRVSEISVTRPSIGEARTVYFASILGLIKKALTNRALIQASRPGETQSTTGFLSASRSRTLARSTHTREREMQSKAIPFAMMLSCLPVLLETAAADDSPAKARPDFGGVWFYGSATPLQRPEALGDRLVYDDAEALAIERGLEQSERVNMQPSDPDRSPPPQGAVIGQEADHNFAPDRIKLTRIDGSARTSLLVKPNDGRLPVKQHAQDYYDRWIAEGVGPFDAPELRPASERCLNVVGPMAPMVGWFYNANVRIVQTQNYFVINGEMLPPRIVPLGAEQRPLGLRRWEGESVAQWDGDTLVVHTRNFRPEISWFFFKTSDELEVTERFRLLSSDEILYSYTVVDPRIYTEPFEVEMVLKRRSPDERLYEFACHEGNHSFAVILRGARVLEREAQ